MSRNRPRRPALLVLLSLAGCALLAAAGGAALVWSGVYEVAADRPHLQPVYTLFEVTLQQSVRRRASALDERAAAEPALQQQRGAACFREHCAGCHGAPGVAPDPAALGMQPLPGPLVDAAAQWRLREIAWITRHGIRMTGMPAWQGRLRDDDIRAVAAFVHDGLPRLSPAAWRTLDASLPDRCPLGADGDAAPSTARAALQRHGCHGCHVIPGVVGSQRHVGPPLAGYGRRPLIRGRVPNTAENLAAWLREPQRLDPDSAMPATGLGDAEALVIAQYLLALR